MFRPARYVLKENDYPRTKLFYAVELHYVKYNIYIDLYYVFNFLDIYTGKLLFNFFLYWARGFAHTLFLFLLFQVKSCPLLRGVVVWFTKLLLDGLTVLRSIHWTILVNMLFFYPVLLCLSCFQYCITISVCSDIAI